MLRPFWGWGWSSGLGSPFCAPETQPPSGCCIHPSRCPAAVPNTWQPGHGVNVRVRVTPVNLHSWRKQLSDTTVRNNCQTQLSVAQHRRAHLCAVTLQAPDADWWFVHHPHEPVGCRFAKPAPRFAFFPVCTLAVSRPDGRPPSPPTGLPSPACVCRNGRLRSRHHGRAANGSQPGSAYWRHRIRGSGGTELWTWTSGTDDGANRAQRDAQTGMPKPETSGTCAGLLPSALPTNAPPPHLPAGRPHP